MADEEEVEGLANEAEAGGRSDKGESDATSAKCELECEKLTLEIAELRSWKNRVLPALSTVASLLAAVVLIYAAIEGRNYVERQKEQLEWENWILGHREETVKEVESAWLEASRLALHEPSGLVAMNIEAAPGVPLALAVDDETDVLFVLRPLAEDKIAIWKTLTLEGPRNDPGLNDPEAVCFDGEQFHVFASHRRTNRANVMRVLHFKVEGSYDRDIDTIAQFEPDGLDPKLLGQALLKKAAIRSFSDGEALRINDLDWGSDVNETYEYALQIEGAACDSRGYWVGLRYPVAAEGPILLRYPKGKALAETKPEVFILKIPGIAGQEGGKAYGISALERYQDNLLLAALNPPEPDALSDSKIAVLKMAGEDFQVVRVKDVPRDGAKLEGIAAVGKELWLVYEGDRPYFERHPLEDYISN